MKKTLALFLCALLCAGCVSRPQPSTDETLSFSSVENGSESAAANTEFESFLDSYVVDLCEQDYMTAHHFFEHPENYGIDLSKCDVTLGTILPDQDEIDFMHHAVTRLESWKPEELSKSNRQIRQQLLWQLRLSISTSEQKFAYLDNIWSSTSGIVSTLTDTFSEYQLYSEADIEPLIELISQVPDFVEEALNYSKKQAEKKTYGIDLETVLSSCQAILDSRNDSPVTKELLAEVDALSLEDSAKADTYKKQIAQALNESFFPAFETIQSGLKDLEPQNGGIKGLASYPNGKEYYEYLLRYNSGSSESVDDIRDEIGTAMDNAVNEYRKILRKNPDAMEQAENPKTRFDSIQAILPFLEERYPAKFPVVESMDYEVKELSPEQSNPGIVAYFVVPPIDSKRPYEIRYNARDHSTEPDSLDLYDTFAHEGIPGHMYQTQYEREHFHHPAQYFLSSFGMQEGYATYAAAQTQEWSGVDKSVLRVYQLADLYSNYSILLMDLQVNYEGYSVKEFEEIWGDGSREIYERLAENPAQFFGYYYGNLKLSELETIARESLGNDFDPVAFNSAVLEAGNVEFSIVEDNVQDYIDSVRRKMYGDDSDPSGTSSERSSKAAAKDSSAEKPIAPDSEALSSDSQGIRSAEEEEALEHNS